ncbi:hypothetical protein ATK36_0438 [Amycolatopsis sulphurea]|uniref:PspA domain-containing protein n=1 Tax=Amycolatopsis sulphurea TaxID=76022 RepID=A0A2A9G214_9PSEU|nr:hypothetical protein [Amycolatopsis sulphurea]PFG56902.1 hypothetical protein ATK36_0438 [Amycolatopsis sulphurea]
MSTDTPGEQPTDPALGQGPAVPEPDYSEGGVPSYDYVRDRIEKRYTTSLGSQDVAGIGGPETIESLDKKIADRDKAAKDKLAEIRRSLGKE